MDDAHTCDEYGDLFDRVKNEVKRLRKLADWWSIWDKGSDVSEFLFGVADDIESMLSLVQREGV